MKKLLVLLMMSLAFIACSNDKDDPIEEKPITRHCLLIGFDSKTTSPGDVTFSSFEELKVSSFKLYAGSGFTRDYVVDPSLLPYVAERFEKVFGYDMGVEELLGAFKVNDSQYVIVYK